LHFWVERVQYPDLMNLIEEMLKMIRAVMIVAAFIMVVLLTVAAQA